MNYTIRCLVLLLFTSSGWMILGDETSVLRTCCFSSPEEQLSKLRSPRTTSKATRSSSTFSPSGGWDEDWRNSPPHWSNRSSCSQRMEASPDRQCVPGREKEGEEEEEEQVKCKLLQNVCNKVSQACRSEPDLNWSTKEGVSKGGVGDGEQVWVLPEAEWFSILYYCTVLFQHSQQV